jgi:hypothetical protein
VAGKVEGWIGMLGNPILEGSKVRERFGVRGVVAEDDGILCHFAVSKGEGEHHLHSLTWSCK